MGYPPGHPLHGKYTPPSQRSQSDQRRSANAVVGSDELEPNNQSNAAASTSNSTNSGDPYVYCKMDQLQNQLNQVLLMMQNQGLQDLTAANLPHMAGKYIFIASFSSGFKQLWIIDSGATDHIYTCLTLMTDLQQCKPIIVHLPNGYTTIVTTIGSVKIKPNLTLTGVLYIPTFTYNLISVSKLTNSTHSTITFTHNKCTFQGHDGSKTIGSLHGGLYTLTSTPNSTPLTTSFTHLSSNNLWYARLGHPSSQILKKIKSISPLFQCNSEFTCTVCPLSKQHKLPFPISNSHATSPFSLVHLDVWGPFKHPTLTKCTYFLTIVDDFSRATWTYFLPSKHHLCSTIQLFHSYVNTQFQTQIKIIKSDNGTEFLNESFNTFTQSHGIIHQTSCPYTPQQNG